MSLVREPRLKLQMPRWRRGSENPTPSPHLGGTRHHAGPRRRCPTPYAAAREDTGLSAHSEGVQEGGTSLWLVQAAERVEESAPRRPLEDPAGGLPVGRCLQPAADDQPGNSNMPGHGSELPARGSKRNRAATPAAIPEAYEQR